MSRRCLSPREDVLAVDSCSCCLPMGFSTSAAWLPVAVWLGRTTEAIFPSSHPCSLQMLRPCQTFSSSLPSAQGRQKKGSSSLPQAADDLMGHNYRPALKHQNSSQPLRAGQPHSERYSLHIEPVPSFVLSSHTTTLQEAAELS